MLAEQRKRSVEKVDTQIDEENEEEKEERGMNSQVGRFVYIVAKGSASLRRILKRGVLVQC